MKPTPERVRACLQVAMALYDLESFKLFWVRPTCPQSQQLLLDTPAATLSASIVSMRAGCNAVTGWGQ